MEATRDTLLTVPEAARLARVSREHMYRLVARGIVPAIRVGNGGSGPLRIPESEFHNWLYTPVQPYSGRSANQGERGRDDDDS